MYCDLLLPTHASSGTSVSHPSAPAPAVATLFCACAPFSTFSIRLRQPFPPALGSGSHLLLLPLPQPSPPFFCSNRLTHPSCKVLDPCGRSRHTQPPSPALALSYHCNSSLIYSISSQPILWLKMLSLYFS